MLIFNSYVQLPEGTAFPCSEPPDFDHMKGGNSGKVEFLIKSMAFRRSFRDKQNRSQCVGRCRGMSVAWPGTHDIFQLRSSDQRQASNPLAASNKNGAAGQWILVRSELIAGIFCTGAIKRPSQTNLSDMIHAVTSWRPAPLVQTRFRSVDLKYTKVTQGPTNSKLSWSGSGATGLRLKKV